MNRDQLLAEFLSLSKQVSSLDFTLDEHLEELERIQDRQAELRRQYEQLAAQEQELIPSQVRAVVEEIISLESLNVDRMMTYKRELEQTGRDIQSAKRVKSLYESTYIQGSGYFIDSHK
ncbi:hypothetical protein COLU111180_03215 [Cohnella lubricantis]|uniref:Flagellar protein FliT n=1 Tax=Cohnella lubricantis TaxID=2163172 RepID=A0A841T7A1_9BACL|nr:hypothetical protein [Cohnella lubricantis]MBB6677403.1 hypothetical protein [Cohnella lubricantis]MBP2118706.1 DNA mismatch repair ATPase MutL [Cohnella lubricantis]